MVQRAYNSDIPPAVRDVAAAAMVRAGRKSQIDIFWRLIVEAQSYSELKHGLKGVPQSTLRARLRDLAKDGLIRRVVLEASPLRVRYEATEKGRQLASTLLPPGR